MTPTPTTTHQRAGTSLFPGSPWGYDENGRLVYLPLWDPVPENVRPETRDILIGLAIQDLASKLSRAAGRAGSLRVRREGPASPRKIRLVHSANFARMTSYTFFSAPEALLWRRLRMNSGVLRAR